ncbi:BnaC07g49260D [Brassica napus]|uniref:40S ribosomal protein S27 n=1 Tax=Brassica napus TaxID=3708 RepID=A0A078IWV1_BRANA|nr:BnaC07g49260D [Brassica napus]
MLKKESYFGILELESRNFFFVLQSFRIVGCILRLGFHQAVFAAFPQAAMVLQNDIDLLNPPAELEKRKHKLKRLVQSPNSFFMDVKCQGCFNITTVFSHSQTVVVCGNCQTVLCQPTGGKARLTEGCSFRKK